MKKVFIALLFFSCFGSWAVTGRTTNMHYSYSEPRDFKEALEQALEAKDKIGRAAQEIEQTISDLLASQLKIMNQEYDALKESHSSVKEELKVLHGQLEECNARQQQ